MENKVANIKTVPLRGEDGSTHAIMMGLDIPDPANLSGFMNEVGSTFTSQLLISPETTYMMLITVIGDCTAAHFKTHWNQLRKEDPIIEHYMSTMVVADCIHGTPEGKTLDQVSLLNNDPTPGRGGV
jgi:hypothetical protein